MTVKPHWEGGGDDINLAWVTISNNHKKHNMARRFGLSQLRAAPVEVRAANLSHKLLQELYSTQITRDVETPEEINEPNFR